MKKYIRFVQLLLSLGIILCSMDLQAQFRPIKATIVVSPPYPFVVSEYLNRFGETALILTNTDPLNTYKTKIGIVATGDNGIKLANVFETPPSMPITLGPGETRLFTPNELLDIYSNQGPESIIFEGLDPIEILQSQTVPEGNYTICVMVYDFTTSEPLSDEEPFGCTPPIPILALDPPVITQPVTASALVAQAPQLIPFQWTPVTGAQVPILYDLTSKQRINADWANRRLRSLR